MPGIDASTGKNPRRVEAGRANRRKREPLSPASRAKLREAALRNRPWRFACGPRTPAGKAQAALNGKKRQAGERSVREVRADVADVRVLVQTLREGRSLVHVP